MANGMRTLIEKYGYLDPNSLKLDELTDKVYNIITDDFAIFDNTFKYFAQGAEQEYTSKEGLEFNQFTFKFNSNDMKNIYVTIIKQTTDVKIKQKFFKILNDDIYGFYTSKWSNDNTGYIFLSYNKLVKNTDKLYTNIKDTLYHEIRHYYDDLKNIIPRIKKGTLADSDRHYINVLAEQVLGINIETYEEPGTNRHLNDEDFEDFNQIFYLLNPTELNGHFHSFVVQLASYKKQLTKKGEKLTLPKVQKFMEEGYEKHDMYMSILYEFKQQIFDDEKSFKKFIRLISNKNYTAYIYYFNKMLSLIKLNDAWIDKQNTFIEKQLLHGQDPYTGDISKEDAEQVIKTYIFKYFIPYFYKKLKPYLNSIYKNIDKVISAAITEDN